MVCLAISSRYYRNTLTNRTHSRTASELKLKQVQGTPPEAVANDHKPRGPDIAIGSAEEAADRALTSVERKLSKALSVEYTINELIAEATDQTNLATVYHGEYNFPINLTVFLTLRKGGERSTDTGSCILYL
jgi:hypothetical protein